MRPLVLAFLAATLIATPTLAETTVGVRVGSSGLEFGFLYSDHYHTERSVVDHYTKRLDEPDLIVALHLARLSGVELGVIAEWRKENIAWHEITHRCRLDPDVYYVQLDRDPGPPYGRAWGHWKNKPNKRIVLSDDEIRALTILKVMSDHTGQTAAHIVAERKRGRSPKDIAAASKKAKRFEDTSAPKHAGSEGKGKNKGKDKK